MMCRAVGEGIFPGAVLLVAVKEKILFFEACGMADLFSRRPMTRETVFDLASLTKPLATTLAVFLLVQEGRLSLDQPLEEIVEDLRGTDKATVTAADLLDHSAGLPAWRPYYTRLRRLPEWKRKPELRRLLAAEPVMAPPGRQTLYSDLGFMLLDWIVEAVSGLPLDRFTAARIYAPLGIGDLFFPGPGSRRPGPAAYAATELCPWRGRLVCGRVHDDNAWTVGGVAGHAGLFGTAAAVNRLLAALEGGLSGDPGLFSQDLLRRFLYPRRPGGRPLGFDSPSAVDSAAGRYFSPASVGHLGFTGASFWMDMDRSVRVVLLTNRVHPSRYDTRIRAFRPVLHDAVMTALNLNLA
ncbi:MAG: beta-lactamase family protein [Desulfobacterales bacterium]|nr:beta-lactamase family protein [Desulfobacterales bacterium]